MTEREIVRITQLQKQGLGYRRIASELRLSPNTVKSYCKRHPVAVETYDKSLCKNCMTPLVKHKQTKQFCSDQCRTSWWNRHRALMKKKTYHKLVCETCSKPFSVYGKPRQRFCSRECFYRHRRKAEAE